MRLLVCILLSVAMSTSLSEAKESKKGRFTYSLKRYEGKKSVVLISSSSKGDAQFQSQLKAVQAISGLAHKSGIVFFYLFDRENGRADSVSLKPEFARDLRSAYQINQGSFQMALVNSAGKVVKRSSQPIDDASFDKWLGLKKK